MSPVLSWRQWTVSGLPPEAEPIVAEWFETRMAASCVFEEFREESWLEHDDASVTTVIRASAWTRPAADDEDQATDLQRILSPWQGVEVSLETVEDLDWNEAWKEQHEVRRVASFSIRAPFHDRDPEARFEIVLEPGQAFGLGSHPSTINMLEVLDSFELTDLSVIDVGTGSGVLAFAARRLGAREVFGFDIEAEAIAEARSNARLNGWTAGFRFEVGGLEVMDAASKSAAALVLVNIVDEKLSLLVPEVFELGSDSCRWLLGGIREDRREVFEAELLPALAARGLSLDDRALRRGFLVYTISRASKRSASQS